MGGERSEMLKTSLNHRNASRQPAQTPQASTAATVWGRFVKNIDADDQRLNLEQVSATGQQATETLVREVYQPTTLVEGRRVDEGGRAVQQLHLHNNQGSCASALPRPEIASASVPSVQRRLENLMLAVESSSPPTQGNSAVQPTNVQQTRSASLLSGPTLVDTGAPVNTNGNLSTPGHRTMPPITTQPLVPSARTSVVNTTTQPPHPDTTSTEPAPSQGQTDDDWLIEL
jgi:helicase required for RNAi-mediated heterochromatin assembly 1